MPAFLSSDLAFSMSCSRCGSDGVEAGIERRVEVVGDPAVAGQHLLEHRGRSTISRIAWRTSLLSNGGMSTAMHSGSQPAPSEIRIASSLWALAT